MGKVILKFRDNHLESFKCKSEKKASILAGKRPDAKEFTFYEDFQVIPRQKKLKKNDIHKEVTQEKLEVIMRQQGLI